MNTIYSNMIELSRQEKHLTENIVRSKNRFKQIIANAFPEYIKCFTSNDIYGETSLNFIKEFLHADIIKSKRIDALANNSYPGIEVNSCEVNNLINIVDIIIYNSNKLDEVKKILLI